MKSKNVLNVAICMALLITSLNISFFVRSASAAAPDLPKNYCVECHRQIIITLDQNISQEDKLNQTAASTFAMWSLSTHALFNITCEKCHGGDPAAISKDLAHQNISRGENSSILRINTPQMCGKCHTMELDEFKSSKHYNRLEFGEGPAPACITCHQSHSVRVLKASEIEDFCSNCHNTVTGIDPSVPLRAQRALSSVHDLEVEYSKARSSIISAKAEGKDVSNAEVSLESARKILKNIPSVWHRFNLTYFETEVQSGIENTKMAEQVTPEKTSIPSAKTPGFDATLLISGLIAIYLVRIINTMK